MRWYLKLAIIYVIRFGIACIYLILPIRKNRILFSSHSGKAYRCSPKYIFQYLYETYGNKYEYVWAIDNVDLIPSRYAVSDTRYLSIKHLYYLVTSAVIVSNVGIEPFLPPRKGRIFINTWHGGGAYKKSSLSASYYSKAHRIYFKKIRDMRAKSTDYVLSSNRIFSKVMSEFFNVPYEKMLPIGMPRNDVFFLPENEKNNIRKRVRKDLGIKDDKFIVLYAPTYRGYEGAATNIDFGLDVSAVSKAVQQRFEKDVVFMFRCHMNMKKFYISLDAAVDVSDYADMQELLLIADMIITDYSSFIWDYAFTYNPGFLYTPDLFDYAADVEFHTPIDQWQYSYSLNMSELCSKILCYDPDMAKLKIKEHLSRLGSYEQGVATRSICDIIVNSMKI